MRKINPNALYAGACLTILGGYIALAWYEIKAAKKLADYQVSVLSGRDIQREIDEYTIENHAIEGTADRAFAKNYLEGLYERMKNAKSIKAFDEYLETFDNYKIQLSGVDAQVYIEYMRLKESNRMIKEQRELALSQSENIAKAIKSLSQNSSIDITLK